MDLDLNAQLAQLSQAFRGMAQKALDPRQSAFRRMAAYYAEVARQAHAYVNGQPGRVRGVMIPLRKALLAGTTTGEATYRVPQGYNLDIKAITGTLGWTDWGTEAAVDVEIAEGPAATSLPPLHRMALKASNCQILLEIQDAAVKITEGDQIYLSDILNKVIPLGRDDAPGLVVPSGDTVKATLTLQDSQANIVGNSTRYGVILIGALVACEG